MKRDASRSAFTLFELVVALAVTTVIAVFVIGFLVSLTKLWSRSQNAVSVELEANIALDVIAKDLESAVFVDRGNVMFAVYAQDNSERNLSTRWEDAASTTRLITNDFEPTTHRYGWAGSWLRFYTAAPTLNAVSYQLIRREPFDGSSIERYVLHRSIVRQDYTQAVGLDITAAEYETGAAYSSVAPATIRKPWITNYLIENVVDFGVRLYVYDSAFDGSADAPKGLRLIYPSTDFSTISTTDRVHEATTQGSGGYATRCPDVVEVFIRVIDDVGAAKLLEIEKGNAVGTYEDVVDTHGRLYSRMVRVISSAY